MGGGANSDFGQVRRCYLLSYNFVKHTFGKSEDRRRFLLLNIVVLLVSSALQLLISATQPLYLATRTDPEIFDFWICMRIRAGKAFKTLQSEGCR